MSFEAWQDGFVFSFQGMGTLRHSSRHPAVFLGFPRGRSDSKPETLAWKGLGACSITRGPEGRVVLRFTSPWQMEFEQTGDMLRIRFLASHSSPSEAGPGLRPSLRPGLRLCFGAPGWDHAYGLGPTSVFDSRGRRVEMDTSPQEGAWLKIPAVFDRKGFWLLVSGGERLFFGFSGNSTELRCSAIPSELVMCSPISPERGMAALTRYRYPLAPDGSRPSLALPVGRETGSRLAQILRVLLSLSFGGERILYLPFEKPAEESRAEEIFFRFVVESSAFGPVFDVGELGQDARPALGALLHRMGTVFDALAPYRKSCLESWKTEGIPLWSHPGIRFPGKDELWALDDQLMFGPDMLLAPTLESGSGPRRLCLPPGEWTHLWTSRHFGPGPVVVDAQPGLPAVFYRSKSAFAPLFDAVRKMATRL